MSRARVDRKHLQPGLYVIQAGENGPVKIGRTSNPKRRLAQLQTGNAEKLTLIAFYFCASWAIAKALEVSVHLILASFRMSGEWFRVSPATACRTIEKQIARSGYADSSDQRRGRRRREAA